MPTDLPFGNVAVGTQPERGPLALYWFLDVVFKSSGREIFLFPSPSLSPLHILPHKALLDVMITGVEPICVAGPSWRGLGLNIGE